MRSWVLGLCSILCFITLSTSSAWASEETHASAVSGTSEASSRSALDLIRDKTAISYYGLYYGPSASDPGASKQGNAWGTPKANQFFLNYLSLSYKATKSLLPGITVLSTYTPVRGQDMTLLDPYLRLTDTKLINSGNWTLYSELRHFLPVTKASHDAHKMSTLGTFQWLTYNVPHSRFSVGFWAKYYWTIYGSGAAPSSSNDYQAFFRPQVFYSITPKLAGSLYYEVTSNHFMGNSATNWKKGYSNVQMGAMWTVMQGLTLNPYLLFNTGNRTTSDVTSLGAQIFATIL